MRPFIHVNCAMSADGKIAGPERKQVRISSEEDIVRVRNLRRRYDAVLIGVGTVIADDPHLTVKGASYDDNPIRIIIDPHGKIPDGALVLDDSAPTIVITTNFNSKKYDCKIINTGNTISLEKAMEELTKIGIENILVEGGGNTIAHLFEEKMVDKYTVFVGGMIIGGKDSPTPADGNGWVAPSGVKLKLNSTEMLGNGILLTFIPEY